VTGWYKWSEDSLLSEEGRIWARAYLESRIRDSLRMKYLQHLDWGLLCNDFYRKAPYMHPDEVEYGF